MLSRLRCLRQYSSSLAKNSSSLMRAQLDIGHIISNQSKYEDSISRRQLSPDITTNLKYILANRSKQLELTETVNSLRHERLNLGGIMKTKNRSEAITTQLSDIKVRLKPLESELKDLTEQIYGRAESLPNLLDSEVPVDPNSEGEIVQFINCTSEEDAISSRPESALYDHKEIGERLGIMDFKVASRILGHSWYYLIGDGALLEQALVQYALKLARKAGYEMVIPPSIVRNDIIQACGFKPNDQNGEKQVYSLENENTSLTGTAEIPLGALHSSSVIMPPVKYVGVSRSYRAEAGARGKDTKGLYRVHEFTKVELFHFTRPENSKAELEQLKDFQVLLISSLGIQARMINMPLNDLGSPAMKKYDSEAWMPGRGKWGELTSCSNCGDYQLRRLGVKYENDGLVHVHTLNGTAMAVPRVIVAIIEQNYDVETKRIRIPDVLKEYMDDKEYIQ